MSGDAMDWTPQMALNHALACCEESEPDACLTIFLYREDGAYDTKFSQSGLSMSEAVALLEIQKSRLIGIMEGKRR